MADKHNKIYHLLVKGEDDFTGILAYSVYKRHKHDVIKSLEGESGVFPSDRLHEFHRLSCTETQIQSYRNQAVLMAKDFAKSVWEIQSKDLEESIDQQIEENRIACQEDFERRLRELKPPFWSSVLASVVGSFVFVLAVGLLIFLTRSLKHTPRHAIEDAFGVEIKDRGAVPEQPLTSP